VPFAVRGAAARLRGNGDAEEAHHPARGPHLCRRRRLRRDDAQAPYRQALPAAAAVAEIERCSGTQFDPAVVAAFLTMVEPSVTVAATVTEV
jgi:hypothetical protein